MVLALLVAAVGGVFLIAGEGARRTESACPRLLQSDHHTANVLISPNGTRLAG